MNIYLAGPLYTPGDRWYLERVAKCIRQYGHSVFLPHQDVGLSDGKTPDTQFYFREDLEGLERADAVIAVLNGADVDSGTAFELGYAYARKKLLFGLFEDTRNEHSTIHMNLMIINSTAPVASLQGLEQALREKAS